MRLKEKLFTRTIQKLQKKGTRQKHFICYDKAQTILLLFESDSTEKNHFVKNMIAQLQSEGKSVCAWGFVNKKEITTPIVPTFRILGRKDLGCFGKPNKQQISDLTSTQYDLLISLNTSNNLTLNYLSLFAQAHLKVGTQTPRPLFLDFIINLTQFDAQELDQNTENSKMQYLFEQIIFYLKSIRSNE